MRTIIRLQLNMAASANAFCKAHPDPNPAGQSMAAMLDQLFGKATALVQQQLASQAASTAATERKSVLRDALNVRFTSLVGIAKTAAKTEPGVTIHLRLPRGRTNDVAFLALGRVAVAEATTRKESFLKLGMPEDLLDRMTAELNEYEAEIVRQRGAVAAQVGAGAELSAVTQEILALLKHIDSLHRLRFRDDPELTAAWKSARNVAYPGSGVTPPPDNTQAA